MRARRARRLVRGLGLLLALCLAASACSGLAASSTPAAPTPRPRLQVDGKLTAQVWQNPTPPQTEQTCDASLAARLRLLVERCLPVSIVVSGRLNNPSAYPLVDLRVAGLDLYLWDSPDGGQFLAHYPPPGSGIGTLVPPRLEANQSGRLEITANGLDSRVWLPGLTHVDLTPDQALPVRVRVFWLVDGDGPQITDTEPAPVVFKA